MGQNFRGSGIQDLNIEDFAAGLRAVYCGEEKQMGYDEAKDGPKPGPKDVVIVHYTGRLIDGTVFDSSVERGEPAEFAVGQVIPGWVEGLQLMNEGAAWRLFIPSELAYGKHGAGPIQPNSTLIFDVQLIKIKDKK